MGVEVGVYLWPQGHPYCWMLSSIPALFPLDASDVSPHPPTVTTELFSTHCQLSPGAGTQNHGLA